MTTPTKLFAIMFCLVISSCRSNTNAITPLPYDNLALGENQCLHVAKGFSHRILLVGDAGNAYSTNEKSCSSLPDKKAHSGSIPCLKERASLRPDKTHTIFLGDNIYKSGLHDESSSKRSEDLRRLNAQIEAVANAGSTATFLPGNHDWAFTKPNKRGRAKRLTNLYEYVHTIDSVSVQPIPSKAGVYRGESSIKVWKNAILV